LPIDVVVLERGKNYFGTSAAMQKEAVEIIFQHCMAKGYKMDRLVMDDDASIQKLVRDFVEDITIILCSGHSAKNFEINLSNAIKEYFTFVHSKPKITLNVYIYIYIYI
jgi:hypothetical protein